MCLRSKGHRSTKVTGQHRRIIQCKNLNLDSGLLFFDVAEIGFPNATFTFSRKGTFSGDGKLDVELKRLDVLANCADDKPAVYCGGVARSLQ